MSNVSVLRDPILNELEYLRMMGSKLFLFPLLDRKKVTLFCFYILNILVLITTGQLITTLCYTDYKNWVQLVNVTPNLGVCVISGLKYAKIHTNRVLYDEIFWHYSDDLWDFITVKSKRHCAALKKYTHYVMIFNRFVCWYSFPLIIVINSFPYLVMTYEHRVLGKELQYLYPFDGWYFFDKVKWYWCVYLWESSMTALVVCLYGFSNMMHASYILFICMELKILGINIEELITKDDVQNLKRNMISYNTHSRISDQLKRIIARHHLLARISSSLDNVLGYAMLVNYSLGAVLICLTAFTFTMVDDFYQSVRYFFFCFSLLVESFILCTAGQILSDHSEELTDSIYSADWTNACPEVKKTLLMFMMRTQKPFQLTASGYVVMNLNTFSAICSTSYQFFNLLRTVYQ